MQTDAKPSVQCTFVDTKKSYQYQYWYRCKTCWPVKENGCCPACALACHQGHDLGEVRYSRFFCDCGHESSGERPCKLYHKKYPGSKLPKIKFGGYGTFMLKKEDDILEQVEKCLAENHVSHYTITHESEIFVEWVDKSSQPLFDKMQDLSESYAMSCESEPEGRVMVWSDEDKKYLDCGPVTEY
jgi:hypothetical protein